jgi:amino acid adenylation domain-containing protein
MLRKLQEAGLPAIQRASGSASSLVEVLRGWAVARSERTVYTFLDSRGEESGSLSFGELDRRARAIAATLDKHGAAGERALLLYPPGLDFIAGFFGCLYAGTIAVPAYPPRPRSGSRLRPIAADSGARIVLTNRAAIDRLTPLAGQVPELAAATWLATDDLPAGVEEEWREVRPAGSDPAFLQYTSGSTADPKGVVVTHGNLRHNEEMIRRAFGQTESSVVVGWLPLYHDMGLIGNVLQPLYLGARAILMSPLTFLQQPARWLAAITRYRATTSGGPNFAYELCVRKIGAGERQGLDLGSWRVAFNGAEPVRARALAEFAAAFAPCGFRSAAFYPCYGLAEATLFATGGSVDAAPLVRGFEPAALAEHWAIPREGPEARQLVSCGRPWMGQELAIVDPESRQRCPPGRVGEIWLAGESVAHGYWRRPAATAELFRARLAEEPAAGPFLRTGDLGFLRNGELFVTGRLKDLIILAGRNLYPQDVELLAERAHPALRPGCGAAFAVEDEGGERLVIAWELDPHAADTSTDLEPIAGAVRQAVTEDLEVAVSEVVFLVAGALPKTSSGKVRRRACRTAYAKAELRLVGRSGAASPALDPEAEAGPDAPRPRLDREALLALPPGERRSALGSLLRAEVARAARVPLALVSPGVALTRLGLDSLAAVELAQRLEGALGASVALADLLGGVNLERLAGDLLAQLESGPEPSSLPVAQPVPARAESAAEAPLSYGQKALWFLDRLLLESGPYHIAAAARVRPAEPGGPGLDVDLLRRALGALAERHPILRTTFDEREGEPRQRVHPALPPALAVEDAAAWSAAELQERLATEAHRAFDLTTGPLLRLALFTRAPQESLLLLAVHHIVADFWTVSLWVRELAALYAGGSLAPLPLTYADYALWQEERMAGAEGERLWDYWRAQLAPPPPPLALPTDRPRPPVEDHRGGAVALRFDPRLADRLASLARQSGATLFALLLAGFQVLLRRYTGQEELVVGAPVAGRSRPELAGVAGYFVNPLPLLARFAGDPPFARFLDQVRETAIAALTHQDFPFLLLAERLQPERDLSRAPLSQAMFVLQRPARSAAPALAAWALGESGARLGFADLVLESLPLPARFSQCDLLLSAAEVEGTLGTALQYSSALFDATTARRLLGHLAELLAGAAAAPGLPVGALPLLSAAERAALLREWNPAVEPASGGCLHDLFLAQARRTPEAEALAAGALRLSYGELAARAGRLARVLRGLGVGPEERVAVCLERSAALVVALLGVLQAGGAYVPLDPAYPPERLAHMLADSAARVLLTQADLAGRISEPEVLRVLLDARGEPSEPLPWPAAAEEGPAPLPENLAYLIYTSGSTGRPKGVAIPHRNAVARMRWARQVWSDAELSGVLFATSVCFDLSVFELFAPLSWGGRVVVADDALALSRLPAAGEVTLVNTVPSAMAELARQRALPASVRTVNLAGEALQRPLVEAVYGLGTVERVWNLYGPSEDTTYSTGALLDRSNARPPGIGRPVAGTRAQVLDRGLEPVPLGVPGELYLGGAGLARGYLGQPALTAERFLPDPWSERPGERLYRTGDAVRRRTDGELEFLGRLDHQVKVRGFRIEPGEIEARLAEHPAVAEAVVILSGNEDRQLAAFVAAPGIRREASLTAAELRAFLADRLPGHMIPAAFVLLPELPRNARGKLDRDALPALAGRSGPSGEAAFVAPRSALEATLAGIWERVLGVPRVGVHDNFFALGGHSLKATQVIARVRDACGVELSVRSLFAAPTVAQQAVAVAAERAGGGALAGRIPPRPGGAAPLSFAQERLWFLDQLQPGSPAYNIPAAFRLHGPLRADLLARSLTEIARRHEILRTTFALSAERPVQRIGEPGAVALPLVDLRRLPRERRAATAARQIEEEARRPFALTRGPLLRALLFRTGEADHALVLNLHHIVADAWSLGVLLREIAALYGAFAEGRAAPLPELPIQYADYAVWQRGELVGERLATELAFWRRRLAGLGTLDLPVDRPRPPAASWRGARRPVHLSPRLLSAIRGLGEREGVTLFVTLLTAFAALLHRYSAQEDIPLGTVLANRTRSEVENLIGFFANTVVLRAKPVGGDSCRALLAQLRDTALDAQAHQDLPFEKLVEELNPERSLARNALVQVMLSLENAPFAAALPGTGIAVERLAADSGTARLDLFLLLWEERGGLAGAIEHSADLFDAATIDRLLAHFATLLSGLAAAPDRPPAELPLLSPGERHQLVAEWNDTSLPPLPGGLVHERIASQAARTPDRPAVVSGDRQLTYRELDRRADRLARHLAARGLGTEERVGICLPRTEEIVIALLAILRAGCAYVPLDSEYPRERLAFIVADARLGALVTDRRRAGRFAGTGVPVVSLDAAAPGAVVPLQPAGRPASLAYLIYTSGSTGTPKGVMVGHAQLGNLLDAMDRRLGARPGRWLAVTSISFDISIVELLWTLTQGSTVVVQPAPATGGEAEDALPIAGRSLPDQILHHAISHLQCTPSAALGFALDPAAPAALGRLERLLVGGEALSEALAERLGGALGGELLNLYGPTEATVWATAERIRPGRPVTLGRPLANTELYVLDARLAPLPAHQPGELYIGGAAVARGYWERPALTAERFLPDPFASRPGRRLYRTGDLVRACPDGRIAFLGRVDHQVKVRGHRIELGEIEAVLAGHPAVRAAAVVARQECQGDLRLVAYLVPALPDAPLSAVSAALSAHLEEKLPSFMRPEVYIVLPTLPLTPNGKVDRKALPAPAREPAAAGPRAPQTEVQAALADVWTELLAVEGISVHDNFFDLGGNSIRVMQLRSRVAASFGVDLPLPAFFEAQTVAQQAARVERARRPSDGSGASALLPLRPAPRAGDPPLSFSQERLWFLDQLEPGGAVYNLPAAVLLEGELDRAALQRAIERIVERHEALRTTISGSVGSPGRPVQVVAPRLALPLPLVDLAALAAGARERAVARLAAAEALAPFDLARGPLLRSTLLRLAGDRHALLLTFHHVVVDGWSLILFFEELAALYPAVSAAGAGREADLGALPVQYADYAVWQRQWLQGAELERLLAYWRRRLATAPTALEIPFDRPRPAVQTYRGTGRRLALRPSTAAALRAFARREGATLFMTLLAAWATVLRRFTEQSALVLGTPTANRGQVEVERLIGFFANSLALLLDLAGDPPFSDLLARTRAAVLADYAHQEIPFEKLVEELRPERNLSHNPIYQAVFALDSSARELALELPGLRLSALPAASGTAKFDLALYMEERGGRLTGLLETNRALFDPTTGERWLGHFATLLEALLEAPERRLSELPLLGPAERHQLLVEANDTLAEPPGEPFVHRLFEARAAAAPDAPAVSQEGRWLTYGELDRRAGRLARRLRSLGVGPEARVAVSVERSPDLILALLGVWKAGGAYVPLDPAYPPERLAFLLADSRAHVLVTQEALAGRFAGMAPALLLVDAGGAELAGEGGDDRALPLAAGNLAYVIYTSGSTGRPKGVMIEHRSLASYTATAWRAYGIEPDDRVLQFCSVSFDISIEEIVPCLTRGAELVLRTDAMLESTASFLAACRERSLSMLSLPTAYWHEITAGLESGGLELPPSLRLVVIAGERALPERLAAWRRHAPRRPRLVNTYGLTESTIISTLGDLTGSPASAMREVPIGRTIPDTEIDLLDRALAPVPLGIPGEIHLGGGLLARGYLLRPEVTAERFIPHPFARLPGARLYKTGDLARALPGGDFEFLGRGDQQVKVRGYRIEPGEIERILVEHPAVASAVVTVRADRPGDKRLVAYLVTRPDRPVGGVEELRAFLRQRLPDYMVPGMFVFLEAIPLTPNGKLDRQALPAPQGGRPDLAAEYVSPRGAAEEAIAAVWREALGVARIGVHDNFFDLGGHSLLLIQIHERLRERLGRSVTILDLFKHPTVSALARHLGQEAAAARAEGTRAKERVEERAAWSRAAVRQERYLRARRKLHE